MTTGTKVILGVILFGGIATIIYLKVKQTPSKPSGTTPGSAAPPATPAMTTPASTPVPAAPVKPTAPAPDTRVGKIANAAFDNVTVYNADGSAYKTAAKGDWIGTISSVKNGRIYVEADSRYIFDTNPSSFSSSFSGGKRKFTTVKIIE